ncbi:MAG TPA: hypothetical protein VEU55_03055 [Gemmatimonadales bacterium]|nr:hypothetical protein [Gemmatimonadales bacterium]
MAHVPVTRQELHDWVVADVRRQLAWPGFDAEFTVLRLPSPDHSGATWWLRSLSEDMLKWSTECLDAFATAVERAQRAFDVIE